METHADLDGDILAHEVVVYAEVQAQTGEIDEVDEIVDTDTAG